MAGLSLTAFAGPTARAVAPPASGCAAVNLIVARASTEAAGEGITQSLATQIVNSSTQTVSQEAVVYPATLTNYTSSESQGVTNAEQELTTAVSKCPNQKEVLLEYSQGAGLIIAHNDATTHNAAWHRGTLTGFFDWDFAGPATAEQDLALAGFAWVPLHVRYVVAAEGFTDFAGRPRRLGRFLGTYGWSGTTGEFLDVVEARMTAHAAGIRDKAAAGDQASGRLLRQGVPDAIDQALADLASFPR